MIKSIIITIAILCILNCNSSEKQTSKTETVQLKTIENKMQIDSDKLISLLMGNLKSEMMSAIKNGGFENAIHTCQLKAPLITDSLQTDNWTIKRVTDKPRNQKNLTSEVEKEILAMFADTLSKLEYYGVWDNADSKETYIYYKPIYMGLLCCKCHGTSETLDSKAMATIQQAYPEDKAIGYNEGDLRGMFVVEMKNRSK